MSIPKEVQHYLDIIDEQYIKARKEKMSRFDIRWGRWSTGMNKELRKKIEAKNKLSGYFGYVFVYWVNRSQLLELHFQSKGISKYFNTAKKKQLAREGKQILQNMDEHSFPQIPGDFKKLAMQAVLEKRKHGKGR